MTNNQIEQDSRSDAANLSSLVHKQKHDLKKVNEANTSDDNSMAANGGKATTADNSSAKPTL